MKCLKKRRGKEPTIKPIITKPKPVQEPVPTDANDPLSEYREIVGDPEINEILIVVGHTRKTVGCVAYTKEGEYEFNRKIAEMVKERIEKADPSKTVVIEYRDNGGLTGAFKRGNRIKPDLTLELHLNAATNKAYGTETLVLRGDEDSAEVAWALSNFIADEFGFKKRRQYRHSSGKKLVGVKEVGYYKAKWGIKKRERGTYNLQVARDYTTAPIRILHEPTFVNHNTAESKAIMSPSGRVKYADKLAEFLLTL